ncbi:hypothetical protein D3C71_1649890 [compost metagenome]
MLIVHERGRNRDDSAYLTFFEQAVHDIAGNGLRQIALFEPRLNQLGAFDSPFVIQADIVRIIAGVFFVIEDIGAVPLHEHIRIVEVCTVDQETVFILLLIRIGCGEALKLCPFLRCFRQKLFVVVEDCRLSNHWQIVDFSVLCNGFNRLCWIAVNNIVR